MIRPGGEAAALSDAHTPRSKTYRLSVEYETLV